jgi:hypothetical protein
MMCHACTGLCALTSTCCLSLYGCTRYRFQELCVCMFVLLCLERADSVDSKTSLCFYADREHRLLLRKFSGSPHNFQSFVVPLDALYYEYAFDPRDPPCFGVRFTVSRLTGLWLQVRPLSSMCSRPEPGCCRGGCVFDVYLHTSRW